MKTIVKTKVYEVRESHKGGSNTIAMFFNKGKAVMYAYKLNQDAKDCKPTFKYRVYEWNTIDSIIYNED